jgi:hypothetical protein
MDLQPGTWCLYPWFPSDSASLVHPGDLEAFSALLPLCKVFRCVGSVGDFVVLEYAGAQYRVSPSLAQPVSAPAFGYGEAVRVTSGGAEKPAVIRAIIWHVVRDQPYFLLTIDGKKASRRYWSEEIRRDSPSP